MGSPWIAAVVPAYNEERTIAATVRAIRDRLAEGGDRFEVIVVDNASEDGTVAALAEFGDDERIAVLANPENLGKGHSVRRGMLAATAPLRLHCDADCAPSLPSLSRLLELAGEHDLVVGSRLAPGAEVGRRQPLARRFMGRGFVELCRAALREPVRDLYCGFKLWRADAAEDAFRRVTLSGWVFDAEAIAIARALGYSVTEVGIEWADREGSRLSMPRVIVPVIRELHGARRAVARAADERRAGLAGPGTAATDRA